MNEKIWIYCDIACQSQINATLSLLQKISGLINDRHMKMEALCLINVLDQKQSILEQFASYGLENTYLCINPAFDKTNYSAYVSALKQLIDRYKPKILLFNNLPFNKIITAQLQTMLSIGLTADCCDLQFAENNDLIQIRPTFEWQKYAYIVTDSFLQMANIMPQKNPQAHSLSHKHAEMKIVQIDIQIENADNHFHVKKMNSDHNKDFVGNLTSSNVVISGGLGLKTKENYQKLKLLSQKLQVGLGATRASVDLGWADASALIGMSGTAISPRLYVAFGISGALQHIEGINAEQIISINTDKQAPIHAVSDYIILEDAAIMVEMLLRK